MPKTLRQLIPDAATLVDMHPSELAGHILDVLCNLDAAGAPKRHRGNFCGEVAAEYSANVRQDGPHEGVARACAVAWSWLEAHQLICCQPDNVGWYFVTGAGEVIRDAAGVRSLANEQQLPETFLHPAFIRDVRALFLQGRYDTAVFEAFRLLEVRIRDRTRLGPEHLGVKLAQRAFNPDDGELTDSNAERGERALMNLMAGAIGSYKNPQSHRHVGVDAAEAREMIIMASHLVNIVESRPQALATP